MAARPSGGLRSAFWYAPALSLSAKSPAVIPTFQGSAAMTSCLIASSACRLLDGIGVPGSSRGTGRPSTWCIGNSFVGVCSGPWLPWWWLHFERKVCAPALARSALRGGPRDDVTHLLHGNDRRILLGMGATRFAQCHAVSLQLSPAALSSSCLMALAGSRAGH
jgi:hypothetical protein